MCFWIFTRKTQTSIYPSQMETNISPKWLHSIVLSETTVFIGAPLKNLGMQTQPYFWQTYPSMDDDSQKLRPWRSTLTSLQAAPPETPGSLSSLAAIMLNFYHLGEASCTSCNFMCFQSLASFISIRSLISSHLLSKRECFSTEEITARHRANGSSEECGIEARGLVAGALRYTLLEWDQNTMVVVKFRVLGFYLTPPFSLLILYGIY